MKAIGSAKRAIAVVGLVGGSYAWDTSLWMIWEWIVYQPSVGQGHVEHNVPCLVFRWWHDQFRKGLTQYKQLPQWKRRISSCLAKLLHWCRRHIDMFWSSFFLISAPRIYIQYHSKNIRSEWRQRFRTFNQALQMHSRYIEWTTTH